MPQERIVVRPVADDLASERAIVERAYRRGFHRFAVAVGAALPEGAERVAVFADRYESERDGVVPRRTVATPDDLASAIASARRDGAVALEWSADRVIPLESAVAGRRGEFRLWVSAARPADVPGYLGALEHGADVVVVDVGTPAEVDVLEATLDARPRPPVRWQSATVRTVRPVGLSDRVLLDTTSLLRPSEGVAVGSQAAVLFLVLSEARGSRFSRPRPFRVNAGAPHSYLWMADGTTRYLSEVEAGEELLAVDETGTSRGSGSGVGRSSGARRSLSRRSSGKRRPRSSSKRRRPSGSPATGERYRSRNWRRVRASGRSLSRRRAIWGRRSPRRSRNGDRTPRARRERAGSECGRGAGGHQHRRGSRR